MGDTGKVVWVPEGLAHSLWLGQGLHWLTASEYGAGRDVLNMGQEVSPRSVCAAAEVGQVCPWPTFGAKDVPLP